MRVIGGTLLVLLALAVVPSLTLAFPAPAPGRAPAGDAAVAQAVAPPAAPPVAPALATPPLDCTHPLPGPSAKLIANDEILVAWANSANGYYQLDKLDDQGDGSADLVHYWDWQTGSVPPYWSGWWTRGGSITAADLDGDDRAELVSAFIDYGTLLPTLQVVALQNPEVNDPGQLTSASWTSSIDPGGALSTDLAAGNLDGRLGDGDPADEVALAFFNVSDRRIHVILLGNAADGGIAQLAEWSSADHGRSMLNSRVAVAVGDVDSNGYDDDIVLAFVDGDHDVQVVVLQYAPGHASGNIAELTYGHWTNHDRGGISWNSWISNIDVATGDFDRDFTDDIAVAFRDGTNALQVMYVKYKFVDLNTRRVSCVGWWRNTGHHRNAVSAVSAAAADIDSDGYAEIVTAFTDSQSHLAVVTLDAEVITPTLHGSWSSGADAVSILTPIIVAAGNLDGQGAAEVVISSVNNNGLQIATYNDNPACPCPDDNTSGLIRRAGWSQAAGANTLDAIYGLALGDVNEDSIYGDYTGVCTETMNVRVVAMVGRSPYWEDLNEEHSEVGYGRSSSSEQTSEQEVTTSYGHSVTFGVSFKIPKTEMEVGMDVINSWEHAIISSTTTGRSIETRAGWLGWEDGIVPINGVTYYTYQYARRDNGGLALVTVPVAATTDAKTMSYWSLPSGQRAQAPTSWVPAYRSGWQGQVAIPGPLGAASQGVGADSADLNGNGAPDYVWAWIDHPSSGANTIRYRIGWDLGPTGQPASWSAAYTATVALGAAHAGLGAALTELNGTGAPELVLAWVDDLPGDDQAHYSVGWDLDAAGAASSWSAPKPIPGGLGASTQGAGLDIFDLNGNGRPELFFGWIDHPADFNYGYYRVGWDLDANGDSANWWADPQPIQGAFGSQDQGLGLTLADMDSDGRPELIAAWMRNPDGENEWAYVVGESLDANAHVGSWTPGLPMPGPVGDTTDFCALAAADLVSGDNRPELIASWIDHPATGSAAWLRVGQYWPLSGDPDQYPTTISDTHPTDGRFQMLVHGHWWDVSGDVNWRWDDGNQPIVVGVGSAYPTWSVDHTHFTEHTEGTSDSYNTDLHVEGKLGGIGGSGGYAWSYGSEHGSSQSISWGQGWYMEGVTAGLPNDAPLEKGYQYVPYTYMQVARSAYGVQQAYMVLDYFVPYIGPLLLDTAAPAASAVVTPSVPLIGSPSHPDPATWYPTSTVVFTWTQPAGDPAVVTGYRWYLDRRPDTVPGEFIQGLTTTATYQNFPDGLWYLHVRARGDGGWSATAHRAVRLDAHPPQVQIALDPPQPGHDNGWYKVPVTVTVTATDTSTSPGQIGPYGGVVSVEVSADGVAWLPYAAPLVFTTDRPLAALWARAADAVGHTSAPVSATFGLDLSMPRSVAGPGCWNPGGNCLAEVFTDTLGNQYLRLAGELDGSFSGAKGLAIRINGANWAPATAVVGNRWFFTSTQELGAGCHKFDIRAEDRAGNVEHLHTYVSGVVWLPREQPDLAGSSLWVEPATVRPGEVVTFTVAVRNGGWQETWVPITVTLPPGLHALTDTIRAGGTYDPAARAVVWPPRTLWPGQDRYLTFSARVDAGSPAATLVVPLTVQGAWPLAGDCPPAARADFLAMQTTTVVTTTVNVNPALPVGADMLPPTLYGLGIVGQPAANVREVELRLSASPDARWLYLREWTWDAAGGTWAVAQESGWRPYAASYPWTLSEGDGVKYLGAWLADAWGNVSVLDSRGLAYINLLNLRQALAAGQRVQYRFPLYRGALAVFNLIAHQGDPNLYVWQPGSGFRPHYSAAGTSLVDTVGFRASQDGPYLVEVQAEGDAVYQLFLAGDVAPQGTAGTDAASSPAHPLTVSDPLSTGAAMAPAPPVLRLYLPIVMRDF